MKREILKLNRKEKKNLIKLINAVNELLDIDKSTIKSKEIVYYEGDTLTQLITDNFDNVVFDMGMLLEIEDYKTPADWSTFIYVYVNGEESNVGISDIVIANGMKISLIITEYIPYE